MCAQRVLGYCRKTVRPAIKNVEHGDKMSPTFLELSIREKETALKFKIMTTEIMRVSNPIRIYVSSAKARYKNTQTTIYFLSSTYVLQCRTT